VQGLSTIHLVLAIRDKTDIYPYTEVIWLLPESQASQEQIDTSFLNESLPRPPGLVPVLSGFYLNQSELFAADWSSEDKAAFWDFIHVRADHLFVEALVHVTKAQDLLRNCSDSGVRLLVTWWDAGVHPAQTGVIQSEIRLPPWDDYDMLAAIGQMRGHMKTMQLTGSLLDDQMRETAMWTLYAGLLPQLQDWPDPAVPTRVASQQARTGQWMDNLPATERTTIHQQCVCECVALWDHFGPSLETKYPEPYEILNLVVISPEGGECFNR
jgi:hypothetical protein